MLDFSKSSAAANDQRFLGSRGAPLKGFILRRERGAAERKIRFNKNVLGFSNNRISRAIQPSLN
jgi:hypothetical protein